MGLKSGGERPSAEGCARLKNTGFDNELQKQFAEQGKTSARLFIPVGSRGEPIG
jgi:hypothetical protein